jgi:hypothetical protein
MTEPALYHRHGAPYQGGHGTPTGFDAAKGCAVIRYIAKCGRCGGAGGSEKWAHTGWTCFDCGGSGKASKITTEKLYTAERLAKLDASADKRRAKAAAEQAERRRIARASRKAALAPDLDVLRTFWPLRHAITIEQREHWGPDTPHIKKPVHEILRSILKRGEASDRQIEALGKFAEGHTRRIAEERRRRQAQHVGTPGDRLDTKLRLIRTMAYPSAWGEFRISIFRDEAGNTFKGTGKLPREFYDVIRYARDDIEWRPRPEFLAVRASVKAHETYKDEPQTVITRIKVLEAATAA